MKQYRFDEHGKGYKLGKTLQSYRPEFSIFLSLIPSRSKVLDAGCGDGFLGKLLINQKQCTVFGFDLDKTGVIESKRKGVKARVWDGNDKLPYPKGYFDVSMSSTVLEFIEKPDYFMSELFRVSKGSVIVSFPNFGFWMYRLQMLFGKFPNLSLFGHKWWNTRQIKFFSLNDFLSLPYLKNKTPDKIIGIDWKNRNVSFFSKFAPNFFARACIVVYLNH